MNTNPRPNRGKCILRARAACLAVILAAVAASSGCGQATPGRVPVFKTAGRITFQNQPAVGAFVVLHPRSAGASEVPRPTAHVKPDGSFETTTFDSADGAPAGDYVVTVEWRKLIEQNGDWVAGPNVLPAKYASASTSDLVVQVAEGQNDLGPIALR